MASQQQILDYLSDITYAQSVYMDKINTSERLGKTDLFEYRVKVNLLNNYVKIVTDYFSQIDYANNNFFTKVKIKYIMNRINKICDSNYNLDL